MKKKVATLLRRFADRLYKEPTYVRPLTYEGIPVEPVRFRSNYALERAMYPKIDDAEYRRYCVMDLKDKLAASLHKTVIDGGAVCMDAILLIPRTDGK